MGEIVNYVWSAAKDAARSAARDVNDRAFADGHNDAANICVDVLSKKIDGLMSQIKAGRALSSNEQFLLSALTELKSETQAELHRSWHDPSGE